MIKEGINKISKFLNDNIGTLLTIIGIIIGVWQFTSQQNNNNNMEFKRRIWEKQLETYMDVGDIVAKIITSQNDTNKFKNYANQFNEKYWGRLPLFKSDTVESAMESFKKQLDDRLDGIIDDNNPVNLENRARELVNRFKLSLNKSWDDLDKR